jgi:drug/metabolite transporter (DMT)-like permease
MENSREPSRYLVLGALLFVQVLFGVGYLTSKLIVGRWPALAWAALRVDIAAILMFAAAFLSRRPRPLVSRKFLGAVAFASLFGIVISQASFLTGLSFTSATNSAILNTLIPLFTALLVTLRGQEIFSRMRALGLVISLAGVLLLLHVESFAIVGNGWIGDLLTIVNCVSSAIFLSYAKPFLSKEDPIWATAWIFFGGGIMLTALAAPQWGSVSWSGVHGTLAAAMMFAILGTTLVAYFLSFWALKYARSSHVALFVYLQPVVAAALAWVLTGEMISVRTALASVLVFAGVLLGLRRSAPRVKLPGTVVVGGHTYHLLDVSRGGFGFLAPRSAALLVGCDVTAELLIGGARIPVAASVVNVVTMGGQNRVGCQFGNLPLATLRELRRLAGDGTR